MSPRPPSPKDRSPFDQPVQPLSMVGLAVARGGVTLLSGLDVSIEPGAALVLRGPNGAGKTTLLRTLAGLQPPAAGSVTPGADAMAYAAHADGLKATLTVAENLTFWARIHGHSDISPALAAFDLASLAHRQTASLSAGQRRRTGLARLLLARRPIWLLDEPTVSLDAATTARFAALLADHLRAGGLAVVATHIDLGLPQARPLDVAGYAATRAGATAAPADAFGEDDGSAYL